MTTNTTSPGEAARDLEWLRQADAHAVSPATSPAPDLRLLADDPLGPDLVGAGVIKAATAGRHPLDGSPVVLMILTDTRAVAPTGSLRRPRAFSPPVAAALRVVLWFGYHPDATGRLTADLQTAWLVAGGCSGDFGRQQAMAWALAVYDLNHAASGLPCTRLEYVAALESSFALVEAHWRSSAEVSRAA